MVRRIVLGLILVLTVASLDVTPARAEWGMSFLGGLEAGGRLYRARAVDGQTANWPLPSALGTPVAGTEILVEMEHSFVLGMRLVAQLRPKWGMAAGVTFSEIDVSAKARSRLGSVEPYDWDQVTVVHVDAVATYWPYPGNAAPYLLAGIASTSMSGEGGTMDQSGVAPVVGAGFGWRIFESTRLDFELRDTLLGLDFADEESRLESLQNFESLEAEDRVHLIQLSLGWTYFF